MSVADIQDKTHESQKINAKINRYEVISDFVECSSV